MKVIFILFCIFPLFVNGQKYNIQFTNSSDKKTMKRSLIEGIQSSLDTLGKQIDVYNGSNIKPKNIEYYHRDSIVVDVIFFDSGYVGNLKLKSNNNVQEQSVLEYWHSKFDERQRILFYFVKENDTYVLKNLVLSKFMTKGQLLPLIVDYIKTNVSMQVASKPIECISNTLKSFSLALDLQYLNNIGPNAQKLIACDQYCKGSILYGGIWAWSEVVNTKADDILSLPLVYKSGSERREVVFKYFEKIKYIDNKRPRKGVDKTVENFCNANVYDYIIGRTLYCVNRKPPFNELSEIVSDENLYFSDNSVSPVDIALKDHDRPINVLNVDSLKKIVQNGKIRFDFQDGETKESLMKHNEFKNFYNQLKNSQYVCERRVVGSKFFIDSIGKELNDTFPCNKPFRNGMQYVIHAGRLKGASLFTENDPNTFHVETSDSSSLWKGYLLYNSFSNNQPTWCSAFAPRLCNNSFVLKNPSEEKKVELPIPYYNANGQHKFFANNNLYMELKEATTKYFETDTAVFVWSFADRGYPVIFTKSEDGHGHIEVAFPANLLEAGDLYNRRYYNSQKETTSLDVTSKYLSVGAGTFLGFKSWEKYSWLRKPETKAWLYLGYLKHINK